MLLRKTLVVCTAMGLMIGCGSVVNAQPRHHVKPVTASIAQQGNEGLININKASAKELESIKGIGPKKAQAIVDYRQAHGDFQSINDLTKVKGIGEKKLAKISKYIMA